MRRFTLISALLLALARAFACGPECPTFNKYVFSVIPCERYTSAPSFRSGMDSYWKNYYGYRGGEVYGDVYREKRDSIRLAAKRRGDTATLTYMRWLDKYLEVSDDVSANAWEYEKKMTAAQRSQRLATVLQAAKAYKGTKLRGQYALLVMRCNMLLGKAQQNILYWDGTASRLSAGVWKEAMRNIYANALLRTGKTLAACDIYVRQEDYASVRWAMRNYRTLAGIKSVYAQDKNAFSLQYLVQDFVNNVQETMDTRAELTGYGLGESDVKESVKNAGGQAVYEDEARQFVSFALAAAKDGGCDAPAMWQAAAAWVSYLLGDGSAARTEAEKAVGMKGTERMADNARAVRLIASTAGRGEVTDSYRDFLLDEFEWLDGKIKAERGQAGKGGEYANHYTDVKERMVHKGLMPLYRVCGLANGWIALHAMCDANENDFLLAQMKAAPADYTYANYPLGNPNNTYGGGCTGLCSVLDTLSAASLAGYYKYITEKKPAGTFEAYVVGQVYKDADYFCDLIGTKCIAEGDYAAAEAWLEKVSLGYVSAQYISHYAARRDYTKEAWFERQRVKYQDAWSEAGSTEPLTANYKIAYCRYVRGLKDALAAARKDSEEQKAVAYKLAAALYQASPYGDCWYLTHYGKSVDDSARTGEMDYAAEATRCLAMCKTSSDGGMRYKALYALAFMPVDNWYSTDWGTAADGTFGEIITLRPQSARYKALRELIDYADANPLDTDSHYTRCDVVKQFRKESGAFAGVPWRMGADTRGVGLLAAWPR